MSPAADSIEAASERSAPNCCRRAPLWAATSARRGFWLRAKVMTLAPDASNCSANASPRPREAPVTTATVDVGMSDSLFQTRNNEGVEVTVQHLLRIGNLHIGAKVLDAALIEHIGTNLVAPAHISFGVFQLLLFRHARAQLHLVEARLQHLHGFRTVTVLGTVVLTLHHNARRKVGDTHGGVGFVNVLTARTTGTVRVDAQVCRVDFHLNRIVDLGVDEYTGKRGVAAVRRIEGALAHQAVYTCFGTKVSVSVFPRHLDGGRLDARYFAFGFFQNFSLEILVLAVAQVLAQQHGR